MSQIFSRENLSFQQELRFAFRGDAGEQKKARDKFSKAQRKRVLSGRTPVLGISGLPGTPALGSNIFKNNLGGTNR